jgi:hypothetical protein
MENPINPEIISESINTITNITTNMTVENASPNTNVNNTEPKKKLSLEMIFASLSLLISLFTFVITAMQTQIMQNQQKAAVWAYLEGEVGISSQGFYYEVQNKGVGAAIIQNVSYICKGKKYEDFTKLAEEMVQDSTFNYDYYSTNPINKKVFAAGEKIRVFYVKDMKYAEKLVKSEIIVEIQYVNIYGEVFYYKSKS